MDGGKYLYGDEKLMEMTEQSYEYESVLHCSQKHDFIQK